MQEELQQTKHKSNQSGHCVWNTTDNVYQQTNISTESVTSSITPSNNNYHANFIPSIQCSSQQNQSNRLNSVLITPKRKSLELYQQEKLPDVLIQHTRLLDPNSSSKRISNRSHELNSSSQNDIIQEKSEVEEDDNQPHKQFIKDHDNMLFGCIVEVVQCKSQRDKHQYDGITFYSHQSAIPVPSQDFSANTTEKLSREELEMRQIEDQLHIQNNVPQIICRCALFWKRENCTTEDYRKFGKLIGDYVELRMKPKPLNFVGQCLLQNGFFVLAFIKYMSMPESLEQQQACQQALNIQDSLFEIIKKEYLLRSNRQEFQQGYQQNLKRQAQSRIKHINSAKKSEDKKLSSNDLKRDPMLLSPMNIHKITHTQKTNNCSKKGKTKNEKKSQSKNKDTTTKSSANHDQAIQTDRNI